MTSSVLFVRCLACTGHVVKDKTDAGHFRSNLLSQHAPRLEDIWARFATTEPTKLVAFRGSHAYHWAKQEHGRHAAAGNEKLRRRYRRLH